MQARSNGDELGGWPPTGHSLQAHWLTWAAAVLLCSPPCEQLGKYALCLRVVLDLIDYATTGRYRDAGILLLVFIGVGIGAPQWNKRIIHWSSSSSSGYSSARWRRAVATSCAHARQHGLQ